MQYEAIGITDFVNISEIGLTKIVKCQDHFLTARLLQWATCSLFPVQPI